jgi:hypothetical protein
MGGVSCLAWVSIFLISGVTLGNAYDLFVPQFPHVGVGMIRAFLMDELRAALSWKWAYLVCAKRVSFGVVSRVGAPQTTLLLLAFVALETSDCRGQGIHWALAEV